MPNTVYKNVVKFNLVVVSPYLFILFRESSGWKWSYGCEVCLCLEAQQMYMEPCVHILCMCECKGRFCSCNLGKEALTLVQTMCLIV